MKPDDFRRLVTAGLTTDQIAVVMEMFDERDEDRKASQRARWRKHQENKKNTNVSSRELTTANVPHGGATRGEDKPLPQKIEPQESKKEQSATSAKRSADAFTAELSDLDPELLASFVQVRRNKRGTLTGLAARMFREDAAKCGMSVAEAAKECVRSAWITVKPEYFSARPRGSPAPQKPTLASAFGQISSELRQRNEIRSGTGDGSFQPVVLDLPAVRRG